MRCNAILLSAAFPCLGLAVGACDSNDNNVTGSCGDPFVST
jgi:hypothetical protein